jgi:uncharacterized protein YecT (DUF1311 family)
MKAKPVLLTLTTALLTGTVGNTGRPLPAQSQAELNTNVARELRSAEAQIEELLRSLTTKAKGHPEALAKLDRAQAAWVTYRDAHLDSLWPSADALRSYGSVHPMCVLMERTKLTMQRIAALRLMLKAEEGEVCFGAWPK